MAMQRPPHADLHPMRVLFVIPKAEQPILEGKYSSAFKAFVACCTNKDPLQRPSATELLKHPFLKVCWRKTTMPISVCSADELDVASVLTGVDSVVR